MGTWMVGRWPWHRTRNPRETGGGPDLPGRLPGASAPAAEPCVLRAWSGVQSGVLHAWSAAQSGVLRAWVTVPGRRLEGRLSRLRVLARVRGEQGMSTAEYAVGTIAACAFAALLFKVVTSPGVREMLTDLVGRALKLAG